MKQKINTTILYPTILGMIIGLMLGIVNSFLGNTKITPKQMFDFSFDRPGIVKDPPKIYSVKKFDDTSPVNEFDEYIIFISEKFPHALNRLSVEDFRYIYNVIVPMLQYETNRIRKIHGLKQLDKKFYLVFILNWINKESSFRITAKSHSGAYGLLQIKYRTWKKRFPIKLKDLYDVKTNLYIGTQVFLHYLKKSRGYIQEALKRYNAGIVHPEKGRKYAYVIMKNTRKLLKQWS